MSRIRYKKLIDKNIRRFLLITMISLLGIGILSGCSIKKHKKIVVGTNAEFPPFEYINDEGDPDGFDVALMYAIGDEMGYDIEFRNMEFKSLLGSIQTGGIDAAIAGMTITEDRKQSVNFTTPYYSATQCIILPIDSEITCISELNGKRIAVQEGTTGDLLVTPGEENLLITDSDTKVMRFKKGTDAVLELKNGGVDAVVIDSSPAQKFVGLSPEQLKCVANEETDPEEYGIAVSKDREEIVDVLNEGLQRVKDNGTYDELIAEYFDIENDTGRKKSDNWVSNLGYTFQYVFIDNNGYKLLLKGIGITLLISILAILLGVTLGFLLALMKLSEVSRGKKTILSRIAGAYIDIIRGTPVMVQLLIMYMIIFQNKWGIVAAVFTFGINSGAYVAEIIRAGILAVDKGQMEGGRSLGFTYGQSMRYIIMPQAIKNILPALCNEFIALIKETSIVGYVAIQDLTKAADFIISRTYETFMPLIMIAIIYYVMIKILSKVFGKFERRLRKGDNR